jgi:DNA-binding GntR family transcriptional regulator
MDETGLWTNCEAERANAPSVAAFVFLRIKRDILSGHFRPGNRLHLKVLTARYNTSIVPVREALRLLCGAGLVIAESQRGFRVAPASPVDLRDIAETRRRVETLALERSIEQGDASWIAEIRKMHSALERRAPKVGQHSRITDDWETPHRDFHLALISRCDSPVLLRVCSQIHDFFDRYRRLALPYCSYMAGTAGDHEEIRDAIVRWDKVRAAELLQQHIKAVTDVVLEQYVQAA